MTNTSPTIERVAQALWDAGLREDHDVRYALARGAIEAMRNPTNEMLAGRYGTDPRRLFTEMIDAALEESA